MEPPEPVSSPSLNTMPVMARVPEPVDAYMCRRSAFPSSVHERTEGNSRAKKNASRTNAVLAPAASPGV